MLRVTKWSWRLLSHDDFWCERLTSGGDDDHAAAIQQYVRAYSFQFRGLGTDDASENADHRSVSARGACVEVPAFYTEFIEYSPAITFVMWFCLLDGDRGGGNKDRYGRDKKNAIHPGGVLFGAQSVQHGDSRRATYHQQLVVVSSDRSLYCSLVDRKPEIASNLEFNRWYHLALTYNDHTQRVYLDGERVSTMVAGLHSEWPHLQYLQVGTGCITAGAMNFPEPNSCGWYPFNGLVDDFRVWKSELSSRDIRALAQGRPEFVRGGLQFSIKTQSQSNYRPTHNNLRRVSCSRPNEKELEILTPSRGKQARQKSGPDQETLASSSREPGRFRRTMRRAFTKLRIRRKAADAAQ